MRKTVLMLMLVLALSVFISAPALAAPEKEWNTRSGLFHEGYAYSNDKMYDYNGNAVKTFDESFKGDGVFSEGLMAFSTRIGDSYTYKWGYCDKNWNVVIAPQFDMAWPFCEGRALVYNERSYEDEFGNLWDACGYIDKTGALVIPFRLMEGGNFHEGYAAACDYVSMQYCYINKSGNIAVSSVPGKDFYGVTYFSEGLAATVGDDVSGRGGGAVGFVDASGAFVISPKYAQVKPFSEGLAAVQPEFFDKWGYIDKSGNMVIPAQFTDAKSFSEGLAAVSFDDDIVPSYGFIDKSGKLALEVKYSGSTVDDMQFHEGLCQVTKKAGGSDCYIDKSGKTVLSGYGTDFNEGHAIMYRSGKIEVVKNPLGGAIAAVPAQPAAPAQPTLTAKPTSSAVLVDGYNVAFGAYNIGGNNYFKLRDLAYILSGTEKRFDVGWDGARNAIILTGGRPYIIVGGEMEGKGQGDKTPTPTSSRIILDGVELTLTAYNIEGNNYFKLRDIGQAFDFGVTWDGATDTIVIDTGKGYTPE